MATRQKTLATRSAKADGGARAVVSKSRTPSLRKTTKPHRTNGNPAQASIEARCPAARILRDVAAAHRALADLDTYRQKAFGFSCGVTALGLAPAIHDRIKALKSLALTVSAKSSVGAVWQSMLAYDRVFNVGHVLEDRASLRNGGEGCTDAHLEVVEHLEQDIRGAKNALFSSAFVMVRQLGDPDLTYMWQRYLACPGEEEREGACTSGVIAAAGGSR